MKWKLLALCSSAICLILSLASPFVYSSRIARMSRFSSLDAPTVLLQVSE